MKMLVGLKMEKICQHFCLQALNSGSVNISAAEVLS